MENGEIKSVGEIAELRFKEWLDKHKIPYLYIQQDSDTFSQAFSEYSGNLLLF